MLFSLVSALAFLPLLLTNCSFFKLLDLKKRRKRKKKRKKKRRQKRKRRAAEKLKAANRSKYGGKKVVYRTEQASTKVSSIETGTTMDTSSTDTTVVYSTNQQTTMFPLVNEYSLRTGKTTLINPDLEARLKMMPQQSVSQYF